MKPEFKKYLSGHRFWWRVLTVFMAVLCVVFVICAIAGRDVQYTGLVCFAGILGASLIPQFLFAKYLKKLESDSRFPQIQEDFARSFPMFNDTLRFGNTWIFRKGKKILTYADIRQVYQHIQKTNFIESERRLVYVNRNGKIDTLCNLQLRGKSDEELMKAIALIHSKNPGVKIGYR
ncbi:MAG: hypothetical protein IJV82_05345 [Oscillospiraceae bacterium]|nr:hypothetical protein [Oscillospiraceae bacterium]